MRVALLGAGTVGQSVLGLLSEHAAGIAARAGEPVSVRSIVVRDRRKPRSAAVPPELLTTDGLRAVTDPTVDAVVEVMGGLSPAREWVLAALAAGKPVVTANKALVAECGPDLFDAADRGGTDLFFEAAAAGAVPIVRALKLSLAAERTVRIAGILNGSTNFLLEALERGAPAAQAVAEAQALGYLEADPSDDLSGRDAQRKLAILASIAFSCRVLPEDIATAGVEGLEAEDLAMAAELGRRVKLLAEAEQTDAGLALSVGPVLLPHDHPLSQIRGSANAVLLSGHPAGDTLLAGLGAGGGPTATAVLGDLIEAARLHRTGGRTVGCTCRTRAAVASEPAAPRETAIALTVEDRPGTLAAVASALAAGGMSVRLIRQEPAPGGLARLRAVLHPSRRAEAETAVARLAGLDAVRRVGPALPLWQPSPRPSAPLLEPVPVGGSAR